MTESTLGRPLMQFLSKRADWQTLTDRFQRLREDIKEARTLPEKTVYLMADRAKAKNHPFYAELVEKHYNDATRRHPKFPLIRHIEWGVALCTLPATFDDYFMMVEGAARRNFKKATRLGHEFRPINYDDHLREIEAIHRSTTVRQGPMPAHLMGELKPVRNPQPLDRAHGYPAFGVFNNEGKLRAYATCHIAGEICMLEDIYGDARHQSDGYVPLLYLSIGQYLLEHHPEVKYFSYGTYYGASPTLRRFKRKFHFMPHRVRWELHSPESTIDT